MDAKEARKIVAKCGIPPPVCSRGDCLIANAYLSALEGPEITPLVSEIEDALSWFSCDHLSGKNKSCWVCRLRMALAAFRKSITPTKERT